MRLRNRKKRKRSITIILEKDGETKEISMDVGKKRAMLKVAKKLASEGKAGWQLLNITGDPEISGMFMGAANHYKNTGKVPMKSMMKSAGLQAVPGFVKKRLGLEKEEME